MGWFPPTHQWRPSMSEIDFGVLLGLFIWIMGILKNIVPFKPHSILLKILGLVNSWYYLNRIAVIHIDWYISLNLIQTTLNIKQHCKVSFILIKHSSIYIYLVNHFQTLFILLKCWSLNFIYEWYLSLMNAIEQDFQEYLILLNLILLSRSVSVILNKNISHAWWLLLKFDSFF